MRVHGLEHPDVVAVCRPVSSSVSLSALLNRDVKPGGGLLADVATPKYDALKPGCMYTIHRLYNLTSLL